MRRWGVSCGWEWSAAPEGKSEYNTMVLSPTAGFLLETPKTSGNDYILHCSGAAPWREESMRKEI